MFGDLFKFISQAGRRPEKNTEEMVDQKKKLKKKN